MLAVLGHITAASGARFPGELSNSQQFSSITGSGFKALSQVSPVDLAIIFVSVGLPVLIAFIVGLFAPASKGFQITAFNQTFSLFFAAASAVAVGVSGRMMGRLKDTLWWLPMWMAISMGLYLGAVKAVGG